MKGVANFSRTYTCEKCGKKFEVVYPEHWAYKYNLGDGEHYFCIWSCYKKALQEHSKNVILSFYEGKEFVGTDLNNKLMEQELTQGEVANKAGMSQNRISNYRHNKRACDESTIERLEMALGCKLKRDNKQEVLKPRFTRYYNVRL